MKQFKSQCGCEIHVIQWTSKRQIASVKQCSLHKAAPKLLKAAKSLLSLAEANVPDGHYTEHQQIGEARRVIEEAEAK